MKLKSLLLGSTAALVAVSGARAADAVVIPEPELVEYVRVCDVYGAGFFYIPGTETCLQISGYVRYEMNFSDDDFGRLAISRDEDGAIAGTVSVSDDDREFFGTFLDPDADAAVLGVGYDDSVDTGDFTPSVFGADQGDPNFAFGDAININQDDPATADVNELSPTAVIAGYFASLGLDPNGDNSVEELALALGNGGALPDDVFDALDADDSDDLDADEVEGTTLRNIFDVARANGGFDVNEDGVIGDDDREFFARLLGASNIAPDDGVGDWGKRSDVRVNIDARNETELGTLRSYIRLGYDSNPMQDGDNDLSGFSIDHAYITLAGVTVGKKNTWWDWGFGADADALVSFGPGEVGMVAYTANFGGFAFTLAAEDDNDGDYMPDIVFDMVGAVGSFGVHAGLAYNESVSAVSGKIAASYDFGPAALQLGYQYSEAGATGAAYMSEFEHVFGGDVNADLTEKLNARLGVNYGNNWYDSGVNATVLGAGVNYKLVEGFDIDARVNYTMFHNDAGLLGDNVTSGRIRLTRTF